MTILWTQRSFKVDIWKAMHTTFPIASTSEMVRNVPMEEDGEIIEPNTITKKWVNIQYVDSSKVEDIEDSKSEYEDGKERQEQARKELT